MTALGAERLWHENTQFLPMGEGLRSYATLPWRLTMPGSGDGQFIGPLVLAFGPAALILAPGGKRLDLLARTALLSLALGLGLSHMLRFSLPAFVMVLMVLSVVLTSDRNRPWGKFWSAALALSAAFCFASFTGVSAKYYDGSGVWTGRETREAYLDRKLQEGYSGMSRWIGLNLPGDARVLLVGDSRGVYYDRQFVANSVFDEPFLAGAARKERDAAGILRRVREAGITHLAVNIPEGLRNSKEYGQYALTQAQWAVLNEFVSRGIEPLYWKDYLAVYEVRKSLREGKDPGVQRPVNPFSFFTPEAYDFFRDFQAGDRAAAERDLDRDLELFPGEPYWWEKEARVEGEWGDRSRAEFAFRKAESLHGLTAEDYREWLALARKMKWKAEAERVSRNAKKAFPDVFKASEKILNHGDGGVHGVKNNPLGSQD